MKILKTVQEHYVTLDIQSSSNQSIENKPFRVRIGFGFLLFEYLLISQLVYLYYVANDFMEYMDCISSISAGMILFVSLAAIVFRKTTLFESIDMIEKLIDTSKTALNCHLNQISFEKSCNSCVYHFRM